MNKPTILFASDSVTDCGRREDPAGLGDGYVRRIAETLGSEAHWLNRGISGDRSRAESSRSPDACDAVAGTRDFPVDGGAPTSG
ncbi:hypothetical protein AB0F73_23010 [Micromonospora purpureochromogenes]|uniref:hypothetical protein n=1 Tax=Micromonospora purpureochromogenes TaxID=47872 RepID=UPI0033C75313